ncbi:MAG: four helix bundle protein [bacterium]
MKFETIENIIVWQKAKTLTLEMYEILKDKQNERLAKELIKKGIFIMNTIAEGYEKTGKKELIESLYTAKRACGPCRSLLHLALDAGLLEIAQHHRLIDASMDVTKLLAGFIKKLKEVSKEVENS